MPASADEIQVHAFWDWLAHEGLPFDRMALDRTDSGNYTSTFWVRSLDEVQDWGWLLNEDVHLAGYNGGVCMGLGGGEIPVCVTSSQLPL